MVTIGDDYGICNLCKKGKFAKVDDKRIVGTAYIILKCEKCNHEVARSTIKNG